VLEILYHHAKFGWASVSPAGGAAKNVEFLSVCLSITLLNVRVCASDFVLEYRNDFDAEVCSCAPCSTFSDCRQLAIPLNAEVQKRQNLGFFAARGRQNKPIQSKFGT